MDQREEPAPHKLSDDLEAILQEAGTGTLTRAGLVERLAERGFGFVLIVLSFPSALPVPAPGYSTPFGIMLFLFGLQMILGRTAIWLPRKWGERVIKGKLLLDALRAGKGLFLRIEKLLKPRLAWISHPGMYRVFGALVCLMAVLMIFPIPLTNTLPAIVIFLLGVGWCEKDGLFLVGASLLGIVAVLFYAGIIVALFVYGPEAIDAIKGFFRSLF